MSELKRTPFVRKPPNTEPKRRTRKCAIKTCRASFQPRSITHKTCSPECAQQYVENEKSRKLKKDRQEGLRDLEGVKYWLKAAEKAVNKYVRMRDRKDGCISCGKPYDSDVVWHASHFKSVGSNSYLRFNLWNIHKACQQCNKFKAGNIAEYEPRLVEKIGAWKVDFLKNAPRTRKYSIDYLKRVVSIFNKKSKRIKP